MTASQSRLSVKITVCGGLSVETVSEICHLRRPVSEGCQSNLSPPGTCQWRLSVKFSPPVTCQWRLSVKFSACGGLSVEAVSQICRLRRPVSEGCKSNFRLRRAVSGGCQSNFPPAAGCQWRLSVRSGRRKRAVSGGCQSSTIQL
jgi:hypothetical protein